MYSKDGARKLSIVSKGYQTNSKMCCTPRVRRRASRPCWEKTKEASSRATPRRLGHSQYWQSFACHNRWHRRNGVTGLHELRAEQFIVSKPAGRRIDRCCRIVFLLRQHFLGVMRRRKHSRRICEPQVHFFQVRSAELADAGCVSVSYQRAGAASG